MVFFSILFVCFSFMQGLCRPTNMPDHMSQTSSIEDLEEPDPELFGLLTEEEDTHNRWSVYKHHIHQDVRGFQPDSAGISDIQVEDNPHLGNPGTSSHRR